MALHLSEQQFADLKKDKRIEEKAVRVGQSQERRFRSKLEAAYAGYLHVLMLAGDIQFYKFEPLTLILGADCRLTPDFLVMTKDGTIELHEVKGFRREDAMIKLRVAARTFHWWPLILVERKRGVWEQKEMRP